MMEGSATAFFNIAPKIRIDNIPNDAKYLIAIYLTGKDYSLSTVKPFTEYRFVSNYAATLVAKAVNASNIQKLNVYQFDYFGCGRCDEIRADE